MVKDTKAPSDGEQPRPTVYVVDDDPALCAACRSLIESVGLPVETYLTAKEFLERFDPERAGCLVLDIRMPDMTGIQLQRELNARKVTLPIIFTTAYADVPTAVRAMRKGAYDFVQKPIDSEILLERIHEAIEADRNARDKRSQTQESALRFAKLTTREREVMERMISGQTNKEIAYDLGLSPKTIEVHRARLMRKVQVNSLAQLVRLATLAEL
ncbi:MAG: response regulator transcription factor [Candidatus Binatia bacterium]